MKLKPSLQGKNAPSSFLATPSRAGLEWFGSPAGTEGTRLARPSPHVAYDPLIRRSCLALNLLIQYRLAVWVEGHGCEH